MVETLTIAGFQFSYPQNLQFPLKNKNKGIYAIHRYHNEKFYRVYVGSAFKQTFEERITISHHAYDCWKIREKQGGRLTIAFLQMNNFVEDKILARENQIIQETNPPCNKTK